MEKLLKTWTLVFFPKHFNLYKISYYNPFWFYFWYSRSLLLYFCSDKGTVYSARAYKIPECSRAAAGTPLVQVVPYLWPTFLTCNHLSVLFNADWILLDPDLIPIWWWENNFDYSSQWIWKGTISYDAYYEGLYQENFSRLFLINKVNWDHSNSTGLCTSFLPQNISTILYLFIYILNWQVPGDELKWVRHCTNDDFVAMASHNGMVIMCPCGNVSQ